MTVKQVYINNYSTTIASTFGASDTFLQVAAAPSGFVLGANEELSLTIYRQVGVEESGHEVVLATTLVGNQFTVLRSQEGAAASEFAVGDRVEARVTAHSMNDLVSDILSRETASTALISGGILSINVSTTSIDITAGSALFMDYSDPENPVGEVKEFTAFSNVSLPGIGTQTVTYVGIDESLAIIKQAGPFTATQRRTIVQLGLAVHSDHVIVNAINQITSGNRALLNQFQDLADAVGPVTTTGAVYSPNGANLNLNRSAGLLFKYGSNYANDLDNPHQVTISAQTALTFRYRQADSTEGADVTVIDPSVYDNAGVLTAVGTGNFSVQRIYMFQTGLTRIQYGQAVYTTLANALDGITRENFIVDANIAANAVARAYLVVRNNVTQLNNTAQANFVAANKFGSASSGAAGGALVPADIIAALGYTPENVADKDAVDGYAARDTTYTKTETDTAVATRINEAGDTMIGNLLFTRIDKGSVGTGTVTFDVQAAFEQRLQVTGALTYAFSNWPTAGIDVGVKIKMVNWGSAVVTPPTINWQLPAGGFTTSFATYLTAIGRTALQSAGTDFGVFWSDDAGATIYGKLV